MSYKVKCICLKSSWLIAFLLFLQVGFAQVDFTGVTTLLEQNQKLLGNDIVTLIARGDSLVYKKELGTFNARTKAPIASCSKWLTAALIMILVDEGSLSLDDKVAKYIPIYKTYGKSYITIATCLSHLTGIESEPFRFRDLAQRKKFLSLQEEVESFAKKEIQANPGEEFRYSNIGLNIAGRIAEIVTKKRFDLLIRQKLFVPLGMRGTSFTSFDGTPPNPSGGAISTAEDYMKFLVMLLNKGKGNGKQILSENSVDYLFRVQTRPDIIKYAPAAAAGDNYASGAWVLEEKDGKATALASPGLFGTWPMIDICRDYAAIIFVKSLLGEQRAEVDRKIKEAIDEQMTSSCR